MRCKYCDKALSIKKGEIAHGCLDCYLEPWQEKIDAKDAEIERLNGKCNGLELEIELKHDYVTNINGMFISGSKGNVRYVSNYIKTLTSQLDVEIQSKSKMREEYRSLDLLYGSQQERIKELEKINERNCLTNSGIITSLTSQLEVLTKCAFEYRMHTTCIEANVFNKCSQCKNKKALETMERE